LALPSRGVQDAAAALAGGDLPALADALQGDLAELEGAAGAAPVPHGDDRVIVVRRQATISLEEAGLDLRKQPVALGPLLFERLLLLLDLPAQLGDLPLEAGLPLRELSSPSSSCR